MWAMIKLSVHEFVTNWRLFRAQPCTLLSTAWMPTAKPSMISSGTVDMRPKSKKKSRPSSPVKWGLASVAQIGLAVHLHVMIPYFV